MADATPRILVIEQDPLILELLCEILQSNGFQPLASDHPLDPEDVRQLRPGAVLVDPFTTAVPSGWSYLRLLRNQPGLHEVPLILCTAAHERLRGITANELQLISTVVLMPFDLDELLDAVRAATGSDIPTSPFPWLASAEQDVRDAGD